MTTEITPDEAEAGSPGWRALALAIACYAATIVAATPHVARHIGSALPHSRIDPLQHLWIMRWYKTCLREGRSPFRCPDVQAPVGAPLGNFSPMHLQSILYLGLSAATGNDILIYNLLWYLGFVFTGIGTYLLIWQVLRDRACAGFGGLLAMLSTPMMYHAHGHLELIYLGGFSLFLAAWMRLVDRPGRGRLIAAAAAFVLMGMCAAYFVVLAIFPAALYAAWRLAAAGRGGLRAWVRGRAGWLAGFVALALPCLALLFASQLWAVVHGEALARPKSEFNRYGAPVWSYLIPAPFHRMFNLFPFDVYDSVQAPAVECASYLGAVTVLLMTYAAMHRVGFRRAGYWWAAFAMLAVLSLGAKLHLGGSGYGIDLPATWLWNAFFAFRLIRVPARFNLLACVCAAVLAAAGLRHLLAQVSRRWARVAIFAGLAAAAGLDLAVVSFRGIRVPAMPACYEVLKKRDPRATLVEVPMIGSGSANSLTTLCGYWQAIHRLRTTGCYSGHPNGEFDNRVVHNSPFHALRLLEADYPLDLESQTYGVAVGVGYFDYIWLYLTANKLDYVVVHQWALAADVPAFLHKTKIFLADAKVFEDETTAVYARSLLRRPARPLLLSTDGWRKVEGRPGRPIYAAARLAHLAAYNPDPGRDLALVVEATAFKQARRVCLKDGATVLARWEVRPGAIQTYLSPRFRLGEGYRELTLESDGESRPVRQHEAAVEGDPRPYSLKVASLALRPGPVPTVDVSPSLATRPGRDVK